MRKIFNKEKLAEKFSLVIGITLVIFLIVGFVLLWTGLILGIFDIAESSLLESIGMIMFLAGIFGYVAVSLISDKEDGGISKLSNIITTIGIILFISGLGYSTLKKYFLHNDVLAACNSEFNMVDAVTTFFEHINNWDFLALSFNKCTYGDFMVVAGMLLWASSSVIYAIKIFFISAYEYIKDRKYRTLFTPSPRKDLYLYTENESIEKMDVVQHTKNSANKVRQNSSESIENTSRIESDKFMMESEHTQKQKKSAINIAAKVGFFTSVLLSILFSIGNLNETPNILILFVSIFIFLFFIITLLSFLAIKIIRGSERSFRFAVVLSITYIILITIVVSPTKFDFYSEVYRFNTEYLFFFLPLVIFWGTVWIFKSK